MNKSKPKLGKIIGATISTPNLDETIKPYIEIFKYKILSKNNVTPELTNLWNTEAHINASTAILSPENRNFPWIRFIQSKEVTEYKAMTTYGWHSLEINVKKVDEIPSMLKDSSFKIIGEPHQLGMSKSIRAMQVEGLAKEIIYLTEIPSDGSLPHLPSAETFIDQIFIVPLGSHNMDETREWYINNFPNITKGLEARDINMPLISNALKIDPNTKSSICTIRLPNKSSIEIDDYPDGAHKRPVHPNSLPPGISSVSFEVDSLDKVSIPFISKPSKISDDPYNGAKVGVIIGNASERIELIEIK
ncbi:MAG: hypothetical protein CMM18_02810 [Rhodospirillaceae bacterium]|nr:hypothetical protein [Rhodospirillaceae bacterium]